MLDISMILKIISVSASGAFAPGPLTASSTAMGARNGWRVGLKIAIGHTIVEFPLVLVIAYGLGSFFQISWIRTTIGLAGGIFLLFFGWLTIRDIVIIKNLDFKGNKPSHSSAIMVGILLTIFNPYFLAWWIGVGSSLLMEALTTISILTIVLFYLVHVWLDYIWLIFISAVGSASRINLKVYKLILAGLSIMIFYFGIEMIISTLLKA